MRDIGTVARERRGGFIGFLESHLQWFLAGGAFVVAAGLSKPSFDSIDATVMGQVANGILHHGTPLVKLDLPRNVLRQFHLTGQRSNYGLGMSLLWVPFLEAERILGLQPLQVVEFVAPMLLAATILVMFKFSVALGANQLQAAIVTGAICLGTFFFTYGTTYYSEPAVALCVAVGLLALARRGTSGAWAIWVGAAAGLSVLFRTDSLLLIALPLGIAVVATRPPARHLAMAAAASLPFLALWAWYDEARFGSVFSLGYTNHGQGFTHPFFDGFIGQFVSPGKGIIWFAPVLLLSLWSFRSAYQRWPALTMLVIVLIAARFFFYASWWAWDGAFSFGPRFLVPALPGLAVPMTALVMTRGRDRHFVRAGIVLVLFGAMMALIGAISTGSWGTNAPAGSWRSNPIVIVVRHHL
jgi:hypothetical protein